MEVPNIPTSPLAAVGCEPAATVNGGQIWAQVPVHELCPFLSVVKRYRVAPAGFTRIVPKVALVVDLMTKDDALDPVAAFDPFVLLDTADVGDDPQAAATSATERMAPATRHREIGRVKRGTRRVPSAPSLPSANSPPSRDCPPDNARRLPGYRFPWLMVKSSAWLLGVDICASCL